MNTTEVIVSAHKDDINNKFIQTLIDKHFGHNKVDVSFTSPDMEGNLKVKIVDRNKVIKQRINMLKNEVSKFERSFPNLRAYIINMDVITSHREMLNKEIKSLKRKLT
jgi:hypothetical protein